MAKAGDRLASLLSPYTTAAWANLMIAEAGASGALTGLVFVAVSINLQKVLAYPSLPGRAAESIIQLFSVLIITSLCLVPGQSPAALGWEFLVLGLGQWLGLGTVHWCHLRQHRDEPWHWMGSRIMLIFWRAFRSRLPESHCYSMLAAVFTGWSREFCFR